MTVALITEGLIGGSVADTTAPSIVVVSPTPDTNPGDPGGFPADYGTAKDTEVVVQVTDASPGLQYVAVSVVFTGGVAEIVYRGGSFMGGYVQNSYQLPISSGGELHLKRTGGWPGVAGLVSGMTFYVDAIDKAGNLS